MAITTERPLRIVVGARLSQESDRSTSVERQLERGRAWATLKGGTVVGEAVDVDVSGDIDPWEREGLGPWLRRPDEFDALVYMKIDRMSRSTRDFASLLLWAEEHGILVVAVDDGVDLSTDIGQMVAKILSIFSEFELKTIRKRIGDNQKHLRQAGKWFGGIPPYWCERKVGPDGLPVLNAERSEITLKMIDMLDHPTEPKSATAVRDWLREEGHLPLRSIMDKEAGREKGITKKMRTKKNTPERKRVSGTNMWETRTVLNMMRNPALAGLMTYKGKIMRDEDGEPIKGMEALIPYSRWIRLQKKLDESSQRYMRTRKERNVSHLRSIVVCSECGLNYNLHAPKGKVATYRCSSVKRKDRPCQSRGINREFLEGLVYEAVADRLGDLPRVEVVKTPQNDIQEKIASVRAALRDLRTEYDDGVLYDYDGGDEDYEERSRRLVRRLRDLQKRSEGSVGGSSVVSLGSTFGDWWEAATWAERRLWLYDHGVRVGVCRYGRPHSPATEGVQTHIMWGDLLTLEKAAKGLTSTNT